MAIFKEAGSWLEEAERIMLNVKVMSGTKRYVAPVTDAPTVPVSMILVAPFDDLAENRVFKLPAQTAL